MLKILIAEDDTVTRNELNILIRNALYHPICITDFVNVTQQIMEAAPDLILLDIELPGTGGLEICRELRKTSEVPIIFVTGKNTSMDELECITSGGDDYISKPYQGPILLARIAAVLKRSMGRDSQEVPEITCRGVTLNLLSCTLSYKGKRVDLSKNEFRILTYLFQHTGQVVSRLDLIEFLWDNQVFIDDNTLSVNMTRIRSKLTELGVANFIETKRGLGYQLC